MGLGSDGLQFFNHEAGADGAGRVHHELALHVPVEGRLSSTFLLVVYAVCGWRRPTFILFLAGGDTEQRQLILCTVVPDARTQGRCCSRSLVSTTTVSEAGGP